MPTTSINVCLVLLVIVFSHLHFDSAASSNSRCMEIEWEALMDFKGSLVDEGNRLSSWTGHDCCSWYGITCHNRTGFVQMIHLRNDMSDYFKGMNVLGGHVNPSLLHLEHLEHLDLSYNDFSGIRMPAFLGSLGNLKYLNLYHANFSGEIPQQLGNLSNLQYLSLGAQGNLVTKSFGWITRLSSLRSLELDYVIPREPVGWLDSINKLSSLSSLAIDNCGLVGMRLSRELNLTSLVSIFLHNNEFNASLHPSFFNLSSLQSIDIAGGSLRGPIPNMFQKLTALNSLRIYFISQVVSSIPDSLCILTGLSYLDLSSIKLQGSIPLCLGNLTNLVGLNLGANKLNGAIPCELGSLKHLNQLNLRYNLLSGKIPSTLGQLTKLESLDVSINSLIGEFSESFFEGMKNLESFKISENLHIVFNVSPQWIPPFQLQELGMDSVLVGLRTPFPAWLQTQTNLSSLSLRNTSIYGVIPNWFHTSNPHFYELDLSNNFLTGNIPDELCNLRSMYWLKLANNQLIGGIPSCLGNLQGLFVLDLANNNLSGHIPIGLGYLNRFIVLRLNGNKLSGELPSSLRNLTRLGTLDLGENAFHGPIPNWIGEEFLMLNNLVLQSNNFSGEIPLNLCQLSSLLILNLPENSLVGTIPSCLGYLSEMLSNDYVLYGYSDTSLTIDNKGIELEYQSNLGYVKFISLSGNQLHGNIPDELMNLTYLQSLNLSNNKLTGKIPERIGNMKHLESLDLSRNHLSGTKSIM